MEIPAFGHPGSGLCTVAPGLSPFSPPQGCYLLEPLIPLHGQDPKLLCLLNWGPRASGPWCSLLSPWRLLAPVQGSPRAVPEPATCEDGEHLTAVADVTWKAHRSKYLKIWLYKATFWPINHPPCSSRCRCCELCCLLFLLLSRGAIQPDVLSDGVFSFSPNPGVLFYVFIYLWGSFSFSRQNGMGSDCCSKRGSVLLAASPVPLSPPARAEGFYHLSC